MQTNKRKLVNIADLSECNGIPVRTLRTLMHARKIPFLRCGHRTVLFDPEKVDKALQRFEVQEVG
jgi:excisionase family DNA binding protein